MAHGLIAQGLAVSNPIYIITDGLNAGAVAVVVPAHVALIDAALYDLAVSDAAVYDLALTDAALYDLAVSDEGDPDG